MTGPATIYVDADACPVKSEVLKVAERHGWPVTFVANGGLRPSRDPNVRNVIVSDGGLIDTARGSARNADPEDSRDGSGSGAVGASRVGVER